MTADSLSSERPASAEPERCAEDVILFAVPAEPNKRLPFEWLPAHARAFGDDEFTEGVACFVRMYRWMETELRQERTDRAELLRLLAMARGQNGRHKPAPVASAGCSDVHTCDGRHWDRTCLACTGIASGPTGKEV